MVLREPPTWNKDAAAILRQFLDSSVGQLFLAHVAANRPALLSGGDINSTALRAAEAAGHERAVSQILSLAEPPPVEESAQSSETYPPLDDDEQWKPKE